MRVTRPGFGLTKKRSWTSSGTGRSVLWSCRSLPTVRRAGKLLRDRGFLQINLMAVRLISAHIESALLPFEERLVRAAGADLSGTAALFRQSGHLSGA